MRGQAVSTPTLSVAVAVPPGSYIFVEIRAGSCDNLCLQLGNSILLHVKTIFKQLILATILFVAAAGVCFGQGTAFSYSGQLSANGAPANGTYDLRFTLCDAATNGNLLATVTNTAVPVANGLFTTTLDFGNVFDGTDYWLQLAARTNGTGPFSVLYPLQPITPAPYALFAVNAGNETVTNPNLTLVPAPPPLTNFETGVTLWGAFIGDGSGLTNLTVAQLTGILPLTGCPPRW